MGNSENMEENGREKRESAGQTKQQYPGSNVNAYHNYITLPPAVQYRHQQPHRHYRSSSGIYKYPPWLLAYISDLITGAPPFNEEPLRLANQNPVTDGLGYTKL